MLEVACAATRPEPDLGVCNGIRLVSHGGQFGEADSPGRRLGSSKVCRLWMRSIGRFAAE